METKKKMEQSVAYAILCLPAIIYLLILFLQNFQNPAGWKMLLVHCGFIAIGLLVFVLGLNPLRRLLGPQPFIVIPNRHRRKIGIAVFGYACLHFWGIVMRTIYKRGSFDPSALILHPVLATGFLALVIFFLLAITSNDYSVKKLGSKRWKSLHHWVYIAEALICAHLILQGGNKALIAFTLFLPLLFLQLKARYKC